MKWAAWAVHAYTASGLVVAALIAVAIVRGGEQNLRLALQWMVVATLIDSTDGWLARRLHVKKWTPGFDGRRLDDIIDFHTYTSLPLLLLWRAGILDPSNQWVLLVPLVASAYGFSQTDAKTPDGYFLGFPSYWNVFAIYAFLLRPPESGIVAALLALSLLTFVPTRYLYPSLLTGAWGFLILAGACLWGAVLAAILFGWVQQAESWTRLSLLYPAIYLTASWLAEWRHARRASQARSA